MKVMFIVYENIKTEARSQEILEFAKKLGNTYFVSHTNPIDTSNITVFLTGERNYFSFIVGAIKAIRRVQPDIIILHDNYCSILIPWIKNFNKNSIIIYDSSELYIDRVAKTYKEKIARFMEYFEKKYLKVVDVVIAANIERAKIMKEYFGLIEIPLVFDNIHRIEDQFDLNECQNKYGFYFEGDAFCIVYGGGIAQNRKTYELAEAVGNLGPQFRLIVAGAATKSEQKKFLSLVKENKYNNIFYVGFVPRHEWRFLLSKADVSVSAFAQDTVNNINCASGKLYESLFEGTPIITTENPPLKRICNEYGVGISDNNFERSILELEKNYYKYCENVRQYAASIDIKKRIESLTHKVNSKILTKLGSINK